MYVLSFMIFQDGLPNYGRRRLFYKCHARRTPINKAPNHRRCSCQTKRFRECIHVLLWLLRNAHCIVPYTLTLYISQGHMNAIGEHFKGLIRSELDAISQERFSIGRWSTQPPSHHVSGIFRNKILNALFICGCE